MRTKTTYLVVVILFLSFTSCQHLLELVEPVTPREPQISTYATGLTAPLGIESDAKGQLWITEAGSGLSNDGALSLITPQGEVHRVVTGFASSVSPEGAVFGLNHLLLKGDTLFMLHGVEGRLYKFNVSSFHIGDAPLQAGDLAFEDLGSFVKSYDFEQDTDETDLFNLTIGPHGDIFIVDAAANAVIRRKSATGELSVFASIAPIDNPSAEPAQVEAVPTGIVFDGHNFYVCTFTGFPFPKKATIYRLDQEGKSSIYQTGLSTLTDIELGIDLKPIVVEYGSWTGEGFSENSGNVIRAAAGKSNSLIRGLNFPNSLERSGLRTYYIAQTFDGLIKKATF
ncbi:ScyD/ScyE family protein [Rhodocytophaga aerolata]|uniref:ScyD/ScyE family protein n=1 Tax=Rhodocytophaga aerolata TaxID=455078 RepID=A0ABT8RF88_9BACT|nr:ScyD/ScyE family protein [Rhodocytophaga aerolata]MDO1450781.1 ScyD/ScyE family protein [Rhodocytophaga aerolata]